MTQLSMFPNPGTRMVRYVGDRVRFALSASDVGPGEWKAMLRTTLGRAADLRQEVVAAIGASEPFAGTAWRDIELERHGDEWSIELTLTQAGFFRAKPYLVDAKGWQRWPDGHDLGLCVHANSLRTANSIYCAFVRAFGATKNLTSTRFPPLDDQLASLDRHGYTVIPPSGTLRQLTAEIPHIVERLGCRIVHLLPINPTPTTYARFGRYGSPYAALDFTAIDPALVEFDQKTTAVDQFRELAYAVHLRGARLILDLAINHTGWGSFLLNEHPEWFRRNADGTFHSPGAWGNTWADLVELDHRFPALWDHLAEAFLTWCRRGVDGFRCDAGYMLPTPAWQYITARVHQEFPSTVFLLEGLGGGWEDTERLLTDGGMQWAYSELFQNYSGRDVSTYLDHALAQSQRVGTLIHYSETHDNNRLAQGGKAWSVLRNRLSALTSVSGGFGFTCGVEWLAPEKVEVHQSRGLNWNAGDNLVTELARLNRLLAEHPCFFDGAQLTRLSVPESHVYVLRRVSADGRDTVLVVANLDPANAQSVTLDTLVYEAGGAPIVDLLDSPDITVTNDHGAVTLKVPPGQVSCLAASRTPNGLGGSLYRRRRAQASLAIQVLAQALPMENIGPHDWQALAALVEQDPVDFLGRVGRLDPQAARRDLLAALAAAGSSGDLPPVTVWTLEDLTRVRLLPPGHWLLIQDASPFNANFDTGNGPVVHARSVAAKGGFIACFPPQSAVRGYDATLTLERFIAEGIQVRGTVRLLGTQPALATTRPGTGLALLTNGCGAMARLHADLGYIASKYDCLLGANLHSSVPCDRHVLAKRLRAWVNADGFITALNRHNLLAFEAGPAGPLAFPGQRG